MALQQMSVTMTGFAATHPQRHNNVNRLVTFRMASTPSWNDNGEWKDSGTLFIDVQCWGRLGQNVLQSVVKGAPLVITGRMTSYTYAPENARTNTEGKEILHTLWRVSASNIGLDLSHSPSTWSRLDRVKEPQTQDAPADAAASASASTSPSESLGGYSAVGTSGASSTSGTSGTSGTDGDAGTDADAAPVDDFVAAAGDAEPAF
ncbi:single-stranded DNA-binding protein [Corynebacterium sp. AOP40-9SA-29]|uniref:single-stranded DNA-binding protein n=1 Tax=Corynebacterium sp. AOP40-9SA-29 TaxID=3457677 RepID=UPI004034C5F9